MAAVIPFGRRLPYWTTRSVDTSASIALPVLIMKDGTLVCGLRVCGIDVFCADGVTLNHIAQGLRDALNTLPARGFLQAVFETGYDFKSLLRRYAQQGSPAAHPIMVEARRRRAKMLARSRGLSRTELTYWLGIREGLGDLMLHTAKTPRFSLFGVKRHPSEVTAAVVRRGAEELGATVVRFRELLDGLGLEPKLLTEREMLEECSRAVNPGRDNVGAPIIIETEDDLARVTPGERAVFRGPNLASQLPVVSVAAETNHLEFDDAFVRTVVLQRLPFVTDPSSLFPLLYKHQPSVPMRLVVTHQATDRQIKKEELERKRNRVQAQLAKQTVDHDAQAAYEEFEALLRTIAVSDTRVFGTTVVAAITSRDSHVPLDAATRTLQAGAADAGGAMAVARNAQMNTWLSTLPGAGYLARHPYPLLSENAAHLTPFFQPELGEVETPDFVMGTRQRSLRALSWRPTDQAMNTFIIGSTGSGKTFYFSHILKTILGLGGHVVIADIKGPANSTYRPMAELVGGKYVALDAKDESVAFNPCPGQELARGDGGGWTESLEFLRDIVCMMAIKDFDGHRDKDLFRRVAWDAITQTYERTRELSRPPVLSDVVDGLRSYDAPAPELQKIAGDMGLRLQLWCEDPKRGRLLNRPVAMDAANPFQVFDFYGLETDRELAAVLLTTLSARVFEKMQSLPLSVTKVFAADEAWALLEHSEVAANLVGGLFRVARSYGLAAFVLSQSHEDVATSRAAAALMANTSIYVLNRHKAGHEEAAAVFGLGARETTLFETLKFTKGEYAEHLFVDRDKHSAAVLRYAPTPFELWIDSSRPLDMDLRRLVFQRVGDPLEALSYLAETYPTGATVEAIDREQNHQRRAS